MSCDDTGTKPARRFEVFTGAGHRRAWSEETRAAIVAESYSGAESVSAVARRHALAASQLFAWRREFRRAAQAAGVEAVATEPEPFFVPAVIDPRSVPILPERTPAVRQRRWSRARDATAVELEIDGVSVRIARGADAGVIAAVIGTLKTAR